MNFVIVRRIVFLPSAEYNRDEQKKWNESLTVGKKKKKMEKK